MTPQTQTVTPQAPSRANRETAPVASHPSHVLPAAPPTALQSPGLPPTGAPACPSRSSPHERIPKRISPSHPRSRLQTAREKPPPPSTTAPTSASAPAAEPPPSSPISPQPTLTPPNLNA